MRSARATADVVAQLLATGSLVLSLHVTAGVALHDGRDGVISLDGSDWQFALLGDVPVSTKEVKPTGTITVPGAWDAQGWDGDTHSPKAVSGHLTDGVLALDIMGGQYS